MGNIVLTKKGKWIISIIFVLILFIFGVIPPLAVVRYSTTNPHHCKTCHVVEFEQWQSSQGHSQDNASCIDCHTAPPRTVPENYSADKERVNQNCNGCHFDVRALEQEDLKKHIIKISHQVHVEELEITCLDCHSNLIHHKYTSATNRVTKRSCYECHQDEIDGPSNEENYLRCHYMILAYEGE